MDLILNSFNSDPIIYNESFGLCQFIECLKSIHLGPNNYINYLNFRKLHFTILNYTLDYTLHLKLFECTVYTLNYDTCYTLYPDVSFTIILDGTFMYMTRTCVLLKWNKVKKQKNPSSQKNPSHTYKYNYLPKSKPSNPKSPNQKYFFPDLSHVSCSSCCFCLYLSMR